jgi:maltoporin
LTKDSINMDSPVKFPEIRGLKATLVAGLALLTADALFAQSTDQSGVDSLKAQMNQMQRQYEQRIEQMNQTQRQSEQRIEAMEAKMKALESNANSGSILNARVLTDADGKEIAGKAPAPMLDESFLKSLTRNFTFSVYLRSGVGFNGNGGPQDFDFEIPDFGFGRWRLGNEPDTYMELNWKQAHILGDSPDVMDVSMTFTPRFSYQGSKTTDNSQFSTVGTSTPTRGAEIALRQAYIEAKNVIKSAPEITFWGGQRFYDRHDIHIHDYFFDDYSGYGVGVNNIDIGFGKILFSYLGGIRDDFDNGSANKSDTTINDPRRGGFYMHTLDFRIHDIDLFGGKLELLADYQFFKGGNYAISGGPNLQIGDTSGGRWGAIYQHPFGKNSFWQIAAIYGIGASEIMGTDPNGGSGGNGFGGITGGTAFAGYNYNRGIGNINADGSVNSGSLRRASRFRANAQVVWNVSDNFALSAAAFYEYDDQGALSAERLIAADGTSFVRTTGGSRSIIGIGIRPVFWVSDWLAIQGQAGYDYTTSVRVSSIATNGNGITTNDTFGRSGGMGIFTIAPTIKPKGGFFTRQEFRLFTTYAIWSNSLKGSIGGTKYQDNNQGWVFGTQVEWFF